LDLVKASRRIYRSSMKRFLLIPLAAVAIAAPASASTATLHVSPTVAHHGTLITITGSGCHAGETAILLSRLFPGHAYGVGAIYARVRANGHFLRTFRIRSTTPRRRYGITARCGGGNLGIVVYVRVR
jgi:hypothetical protein